MKSRIRGRLGKRLPSYDELMNTAVEISSGATDKCAVAGGLAMQIWGSPRLTADLDFVAASDLTYEGAPLAFGGVRTKVNGIDLDVIVRNDEWEDLYVEALDNSVQANGVDRNVWIITPEYLVAMKMVAGRPKDEIDVRFLVTMEDFNLEMTRTIVREHLGPYAANELRSIVEEAKWRKGRGEE